MSSRATLTRQLKLGCYGKDVQAVRRIALKFLRRNPPKAPPAVQRTFGVGMRSLIKDAQDEAGIPKSGVVGPNLMAAFRQADAAEDRIIDAYSEQLLAQYAKEHPKAPRLVEPTQGFGSLAKELWVAYSIGRNMGLTDLGTYNPASRLPSGKPSDHAMYPAYAFDLGFSPQTGYSNPTAREFFNLMCGRPEVEYVICGNRIWSKTRGLHWYTAGGHDNHVHVSGVR